MSPSSVGATRAEASAPAGARHAGAAAQPTGHSAHRWWVLAVIGLAQLMVVLDATIVNIALPTAQKDLGFNNDGRQWIVTAYSLAFGSLLLLGGRLSDLIGRRITFIVGLVGFAGASALGGAATDFKMLVIARAIQGVMGAILAPAALSLLTTTFTEPKERAKAFGVFGAIAGSGGAIGLLLGGLLTEHLSWRWTLYVNCIIAVFAVIGAATFIKKQVRTEKPHLDWLGTFLAAGGLFCLVYGFANKETHNWSDWMVWAFLAGAGVLLLAFVLWEMVAKHPLLPLRVFADRNRAAAYISVFIAGAGMFGVFLFLTYYLQTTLGYSPVKTGLAFLPMIGMLMIFAQLGMIVLVPRVGGKPLAPVGMLAAAGAMVWLTRLDEHSTYAGHVLPPLLVMGFGLGLAMPTAMSLATYGVAARDQGVASATVNTMQQIGGSIGTALFNTMAATAAANYAKDHLTLPKPELMVKAAIHSYATAYWWAAGFFAVGALITVFLYRAGRPMAGAAAPTVEDGQEPDAVTKEAEMLAIEAGGSTIDAVPQPAYAGAAAESLGTTARMDVVPPNGLVKQGVSPLGGGAGTVSTGTPVLGRVIAPGGGALAGAAVTLIDQNGHQLGRAVSGADGAFELAAPTAGSYLLVGSAQGLQPQVSSVLLGSDPYRTDLRLGGAGGLSGTVRDASGPVEGAVVVVTDSRGEVIGSAVTDASGAYRVAEVSPGTCTVTVNAAAHRPIAGPVEVAESDETVHDVVLSEAAEVSGTVRDGAGRPVPDARVSLVDPAGNVVSTFTTASDGSYAFGDLTGGEYTLIAAGFPPKASPVSVNGEGASLDVTLTHDGE
ncbi:MFS transporter [Mangrovactinospora gilvigrisea]|uniref:MFS transporter n=1 Tax=Mangrovactinospora gilvigrisea TaxID=1428644 RepID=A0A1J7C5C5_9ACTN|nr:MFS transporter [Mangrovactinospora gilvigrisea]OIV36752.1 MFS transporter [Mangrovactinospora gilvigrisea]